MQQYNKITRKEYQGRNQAELTAIKNANNYKSNEWVTFLQAKELGLTIIKGSKGVHVFKGYGTSSDENAKGKVITINRPLGWACVFNLDQTEKQTSPEYHITA